MGKDVEWKSFFEDNHRYADIINGIGCGGMQVVKDTDLTEVFHTDVKQVFDFIRCSEDKKKLVELVENDVYYTQMDEEAFDVVAKYTNSKELIKAKEYLLEGGKRNVCKAIRDLMDDSREEGREQGIEQGVLQAKRHLVINMLKENEPIDKICRVVECEEAFVKQVQSAM